MKQTNILNDLFTPLKSKARSICLSALFVAGIFTQPLAAQISYTFTSAGATASLGPTQAQLNTAYATTNLNNSVTILTQGVQQFTIPVTGPYRIEARGAQGYGNGFGGRGAIMAGDFTLTAGTVIRIAVGQQGVLPVGTSYNNQFGGGGGSFVTDASNNPLVVAGGGGGSWATAFTTMSDGTVAANGGAGTGGTSNGVGGTGGAGGGTGTSADGGGGLTGNGLGGSGGKAFVNGANGGSSGPNGIGGFGGGGGTSSQNYRRGGGGGGYSGGGGSYMNTDLSGAPEGGGGGSFNSGANVSNTSGANLGDGLVLINFLCNLNITSTASVICTGNTATLTTNAVANTYTWSTGNTSTTSIVVSPTTTTTYTLTGQGTNPSGCVSTAAYVVTVNRTPTVTINSSTTSACQGQSVTLTASGANTYTWNNSVVNGQAFAPSATALYTVAGTNACGTATAGVTVTVSALPVTAATTASLICAGSPATLSAGGATTYTWMPGTGTTTNYIVTPTANTIYTVTGKTGNCQSIATVTVNTNPLPTMSITTSGTAICYGNSTNLTVNGNAVSYTWSVNGQTGLSISVSPTLNSVYTVTGTSSANCIKAISQVIVVNQNPVIFVSASDPVVCSGGASTLTASGANSYSWAPVATSTVNSVVNPTTTTVYDVTGTNTLTNCYTTTMITVGVFEPQIAVSNNTMICKGSNIVIGATGAITYTWINGGQQSQNISVSPTVSTTYTVEGTVVDLINGVACPATNTVDVIVNALPVITATSNTATICRGSSATITADGAGATGTYTWTTGLGNNPVITVSPILDQTYNVSGTDANGCKGTATVQVAVITCTTSTVGIPALAANGANLAIYPNPSNGAFTVSSDQAITLHLVNELGQQVRELTINATTPSVKINNLAGGIYFILGANENGSVKQKIVIAD